MTGLAAPFGRLEAQQLEILVAAASRAGASELRLSPWRALYVDAEFAAPAGLIADEGDPILRVEACPGAPACASSSVDTRRTARLLVSAGFGGSIHVSGCAKGCARSTAADLVLVGEDGRYKVIRHGTARATAERTVDPDNVLAALHD
jgi:precorrin-3B synthase